ncbi:unnamed protein product [Lathyrus sativus]|nr:unnamed protein product [Lathyrus sativus]
MLEWTRMEASGLGFGVVIRRFGNGLDRRNVFVTMLCERSGSYRTLIQSYKRDETGSRKCEVLFKLRDYMLANKKMEI